MLNTVEGNTRIWDLIPNLDPMCTLQVGKEGITLLAQLRQASGLVHLDNKPKVVIKWQDL
jgi:hypothetical protein